MNLSVMYDHIASSLQTQVTLWTQQGHLLGRYTKRIDLDGEWLADESFYMPFWSERVDYPSLAAVNCALVYAAVPLDEAICLIGPVRLLFPENVYRQIEIKNAPQIEEKQFPIYSAEEVLDWALLLFRLCRDSTMSAYECYMRSCRLPQANQAYVQHAQTLYRFREEDEKHNSYEQERHMLQAIENGDFDLLDASRKEQSAGALGVTSRDPVRNGKNLAETVITLCSRACIRGGVDPEVGFSLCDSYMRQVEDMQSMEEMKKLPTLMENMQFTMTRLVHNLRTSRSQRDTADEAPIAAACKRYVSRHLHEKLKVQDIADALSIHPNYLTNVFGASEGVSLHQYILAEKLRTARQLLMYSTKSASEIALTLGFSSQSHMGALFKKQFGLTPKEFRDRYVVEEV